MIKPEHLPDVVIDAAVAMRDRGGSMSDIIRTALNAWPGMFSAIRTEEGGVEWDNEGNAPECLVLPLPQEKSNAEG